MQHSITLTPTLSIVHLRATLVNQSTHRASCTIWALVVHSVDERESLCIAPSHHSARRPSTHPSNLESQGAPDSLRIPRFKMAASKLQSLCVITILVLSIVALIVQFSMLDIVLATTTTSTHANQLDERRTASIRYQLDQQIQQLV